MALPCQDFDALGSKRSHQGQEAKAQHVQHGQHLLGKTTKTYPKGDLLVEASQYMGLSVLTRPVPVFSRASQ